MKLKVDKNKLDIVLARRCKSLHDLRGNFSPGTLVKINQGAEVKAKTVGRLSQLLDCDPVDIIEHAYCSEGEQRF